VDERRRLGRLRRLGSPSSRGARASGERTDDERAARSTPPPRAPGGPRVPEAGSEEPRTEAPGEGAGPGEAGTGLGAVSSGDGAKGQVGVGEQLGARERAPAPERGAASETRGAPAAPTTADPAPLGLGALALTLFIYSLFASGLLADVGEPVVLGLAFAYGGIAQLLAGMWEFRSGSTFGATAFTAYGAFWLSLFVFEAFFADAVPAADAGAYLGWTLIAWAIFTTYMYAASVRLTGRVNVVFLLLAATLYLVGIGEVIEVEIVTRVGGFVGLVTAVAAGYMSFATLTDATSRQRVLPAGKRDPE
jgi:succinate-acetate transporter protein